MKSVQIPIFSGPYFPAFGLNTESSISPYSVRMRENTDQKKLRIWTFFTLCKYLQIIKFMNEWWFKRILFPHNVVWLLETINPNFGGI